MKGQKQSRTDALEKRMAAVTNVLQQLINENDRLSTMVSGCLLYTSPSPRDRQKSRMPSSA